MPDVRSLFGSSVVQLMVFLNSDVLAMSPHPYFFVVFYSRLWLSQSPRYSLKYFEISVPRHIRFAELRKK